MDYDLDVDKVFGSHNTLAAENYCDPHALLGINSLGNRLVTVRAFTLQDPGILDGEGSKLTCLEKHVSTPTWVPAYECMRQLYDMVIGQRMVHFPIWAWLAAPNMSIGDKYERICSVESDLDALSSMVIIHAEVPAKVALLTSYMGWNTLMDYCLILQRRPEYICDWIPICTNRVASWDRVQVVLPYIDRLWITETEPVDPEVARNYLTT